jgi:hypothetical protein
VRWSPSKLRSHVARKLTPERKAWVSKLRHGELPWQRHALTNRSTRDQAVESYDARRSLAESLTAIRRALGSAGLEFVELPRLSFFAPTVVVDSEFSRPALRALTTLRCSDAHRSKMKSPWTIRYFTSDGSEISARNGENHPDRIAAITCLRHQSAANGRELSTTALTVTVELWQSLEQDHPRADGATHIAGTLHRQRSEHDLAVDYIEPAVWFQAVRNDNRLGLPAPHLRTLQEPVDIVYTWVDGADPDWRARMHKALESADLRATEPSALADSRFTSRDELKYSLRSLEYYASWANHIYIVTDSQVPSWLNTDHPKITVVDHRDIFTDPSVLPVFNSHAIESQLHHIRGLSERYVYLNDDCFFLRPTDPELFYSGNGLAKHFPSVVPIDVGGWSPRDLPIISAAKQGRDYLLETYGRTVTHRFKHTPHPQIRPVLEAMERERPEIFAQVAASVFRSPNDYSIASSLHHFDAFERGLSVEGQIGYQFIDLGRPDLDLQLARVARAVDLDVFCLNETTLSEESREAVDRAVSSFLSERFPVPSSFELNSTKGSSWIEDSSPKRLGSRSRWSSESQENSDISSFADMG